MIIHEMYSSEKMEWGTPQKLFDQLNERFGFTLDPCASDENHKCPKYYTKESNGLLQHWEGNVFCNPPYGKEIKNWVRKCSEERNNCNVIVLLIFARTDTKYFHDYIYQKEGVELEFIKGRVRFGSGAGAAPFPSMLVIFKPTESIVPTHSLYESQTQIQMA